MSAMPRSLFACALALAAFGTAAQAQAPAPGPAAGLTLNRDLPLKIESTSLEVRDKQRMASFIGNVVMTQGDATVRCKTLTVYYEDAAVGPPAKAKQPEQPGGSQRIKRVEAKGDVVVSQKDQTATGDNGVFDMRANTVTLTGKVVVTQGQSIVRGDQLFVDLTSGRYTMTSKGRVEMLMPPSKDAKSPATPPSPSASPGPSAAPKPAPSGPMRIN
jgi:lipopolysaccharide export system protein LptA